MIASCEGCACSSTVRSFTPVQLASALLMDVSTQIIGASTVVLGMASMVVQFRINGFSTSPVTFRYQSGEVGPGCVAAIAVFVGGLEAYRRLMINTTVVIATSVTKVFFKLSPTRSANTRNMTRVIFKIVAKPNPRTQKTNKKIKGDYSSSSIRSIGCPQQTSTPAPATTTLTAFPQILQTYSSSTLVILSPPPNLHGTFFGRYVRINFSSF